MTQQFATIFQEHSKIVPIDLAILKEQYGAGGVVTPELLQNLSQQYRPEHLEVTASKTQNSLIVIGGGMSTERTTSFFTAAGVITALLELGHQVVFVDMGADIGHILTNLKPAKIFNALHGTYGEDGCLAGLLNIMRIPYTGPGVLASALAMNKKIAAQLLQHAGLKVAEHRIIKKSDNIKVDPLPRPYVIKPLSQGSSVGIEVVFAEDKFDFGQYQFPYGDEIVVEKYIKGRELQVAVIDGQPLTEVLELKLLKSKRFYDYETKYTPGFAEHLLPAPIDVEIKKLCLQQAAAACQVLQCERGLARAEFIYTPAGELYILEVNSHPGMTPMSICPEIAAYLDIPYRQLVNKMLEAASFEL